MMKESFQVAITNLREAHQKGIIKVPAEIRKSLDANKLDIHVHYPSGGVRKNGPSAGTSTMVSLWSALTQTPIPTNIALTGEIDLKGNILPIGGIRGKVSRAIEQGVKLIYLPEANRKDFDELVAESELFARMAGSIDIRFVSETGALLKDIQKVSRRKQ
jgi:ATP-dependent Lon protease